MRELDVDDLAQEIRRVDGNNSLGAGALAEALMPFLDALPQEPAGWRLVPVHPTEAMVDAHFRAHAEATTVFAEVPEVWRAMLAAAPLPAAPSGEGR